MPNSEIIRPSSYRLSAVHIVSFQEQRRPDGLDPESSMLVHKYRGSVGFNETTGEMRINMLLTAAIHDENKGDDEEPSILAECATETDFIFEFPELDEKSQHRMIDLNLVANVFGISYSTSRGILIGKSQITSLMNYPPVMISPIKEVSKLEASWIILPDVNPEK